MTKRMMAGLLLAVMLTGMLAGCGGKKVPQASATAAEMAKALSGKIEVGLQELDATAMKEFYGLDSANYEEAAVFMAMINVQAADLAIVKAKTPEDLAILKKALEARQAANVNTWQSYLPDQYEIVKNYKLVEKGLYLIYVVAENSQEIVDQFATYFK